MPGGAADLDNSWAGDGSGAGTELYPLLLLVLVLTPFVGRLVAGRCCLRLGACPRTAGAACRRRRSSSADCAQVGEDPAEAGAAADGGSAAVAAHLQLMDIRPALAPLQAARLARRGCDTREAIDAMPEHKLRQLGGLSPDDLRCVVVFRHRQALASTDQLVRGLSRPGSAPPKMLDSSTVSASPASPGTAADTSEAEPSATVGQVVWVHDDAHGARGEWLPWQRGVVASHTPDGKPLVCRRYTIYSNLHYLHLQSSPQLDFQGHL